MMQVPNDCQTCESCGTWYFGPASLCEVCRQVFAGDGEPDSPLEYHDRFDQVLRGPADEAEAGESGGDGAQDNR
jgi:hypothetical protein